MGVDYQAKIVYGVRLTEEEFARVQEALEDESDWGAGGFVWTTDEMSGGEPFFAIDVSPNVDWGEWFRLDSKDGSVPLQKPYGVFGFEEKAHKYGVDLSDAGFYLVLRIW